VRGVVDLPVTDPPGVPSGIRWLQAQSLGSPEVCVAVLDGPADLAHPCFSAADLSRVATMVHDPPGSGEMSVHGTHVSSVIFGQPDSVVPGVAPRCRGLLLPVFRDPPARRLSQLDLGRAIEQAVQEGAHVINVSGGQRVPTDEAEDVLAHALELCEDNNVLVIAAAGNDGCECLHVPAAVPSVLAVGALDASGMPLKTSNWGEAYRSNGVLAPGERILGAASGGDTARLTGSSFATPIVSGIAALLLSIQQASGQEINPSAVREAILASAVPCYPLDSPECRPYLVGTVNVPGAYDLILKGGKKVAESDVIQDGSQAVEASVGPGEPSSLAASGAGVPGVGLAPAAEVAAGQPTHVHPAAAAVPPQAAPQSPPPAARTAAPASVVPSAQCSCNGGGSPGGNGGKVSNVFAIGVINADFGTLASRDAFRLAMDPVTSSDSPPVVTPANPYDSTQLAKYLTENPWDATKLIWTLELEGTPIYAIEAEPAFGGEVYPAQGEEAPTLFSSRVYRVLTEALRNHALGAHDENYVSRVSIPGVLTTRTRRLYSGQEVPVVVAQARNLFTWHETALVNAVVAAVERDRATASEPTVPTDQVALTIRNFLDKIYYQLRNLGQSPPDRALNYAATNAFIFADGIRKGLLSARYVPGAKPDLFSLDTINVVKSPYCRMDSDCWDVQITFFDPEEVRRARVVYQYTIDVSEVDPVTLAPTRQFLMAP
jgi:cyanobactin maturation PatA/PatG family protease